MNPNKSKKSKTLIIVVAMIIAAFVGYSLFFTGNADDLATLSPQDINQNQTGNDLLIIFAELSALNLDPAILRNPVFISLQDFSQEIPSEPSGRVNPFAPI